MVSKGSSTKLFAGAGLAVPRLGKCAASYYLKRRGTSGYSPNI